MAFEQGWDRPATDTQKKKNKAGLVKALFLKEKQLLQTSHSWSHG
jgi:hypothetical protein